ncbi:hypothetical protein OS493_012393 [Desmophyllum pertusum]|uniref:BEN domain-containing protein n=1 Tax=Desmophyllum pertusum TaxID=174260 RepID=A0A9W9ZRX7_9CNID|nr:hypothetical protein OS493_012393 [Desmophyllum pertusum]
MASGIVEPGSCGKTGGKVELSSEKLSLLKRALKEKFGEHQFTKKWSIIRQSLNQKCLDLKRKLSKQETLANEDDANDHDSSDINNSY